MKGKRIEYIDIFRGVAIILVVLQHSVGSLVTLSKIILSFHMALFFFISGFTAHSLTVKKLLKKGGTFLCSQVFVGVMNCVWYWVILEILLKQQIQQRWLEYFNTWFLPTMFWVLLVWAILWKRLKTRPQMIVASVVALGVAYMMTLLPVEWDLLHFRKVPLAVTFFLVGKIVRDILEEGRGVSATANWSIFVCDIAILFITSLFNENVYWYNYSMGNLGLATLSSMAGCLLLLIICKKLRSNKVLEWFGKNSLIVYSWNFIVTRIMGILMNKCFQVGNLRFILSALLSIVVLVPITIGTKQICSVLARRFIEKEQRFG